MQPPADIEAEKALAAYTATGTTYQRSLITPFIKPSDFTDARWRVAYQLALAGKPLPVDYLDSWGRCYLYDAISASTAVLMDRVLDCARRRRAIDAAQRLAEAAWDMERPYAEDRAIEILERAGVYCTTANPGFDLREV